MSIVNSSLSNITYVKEYDFGIIPENTLVWNGELPYKTGTRFPTEAIKERAAISKTNELILNNDVDRIYETILSVIPEIDPMYGWQIREIIMNMPYFKSGVDSWIGLIAGEAPQVDGSTDIDNVLNEVIENTNWAQAVQDEVRSRFMDVIGIYRVDVDIVGRPIVTALENKNVELFMSKQYSNSIEVTLFFNIYTENKRQFVEFIEYHYDGKIVKTTYEYLEGVLGKKVTDRCVIGEAFDGKFKMSPIVIFKHNAIKNNWYGTDQFRYWSASILSAMRSLQNILRLSERTREMIRKLPEDSISKDPGSGAAMFINRGTVTYPAGSKDNIPEVEYKVPEIRMEEAVKAFEKAIKGVSIDTRLGPVFFDIEKLGTNLSAKSIEAALYPAKLESKRIATEMLASLKELVIKLCATAGVEVKPSEFSITMFDGFPKDYVEFTTAIQKRLESSVPSISRVDAIRMLDKVPVRQAIEKSNELQNIKTENTGASIGFDVKENAGELDEHSVNPNPGDAATSNGLDGRRDTNLFENQLIPAPQDVIGG